MVIKIGLILIFFAVTIGIGVYCKKHATDLNGFLMGGRAVGPWLTAFAYGTSYFSAVIFIGYAGQFGWKYGIAATWIGIGNAVIGSLLAWIVLAKRTRSMSQYYNSATMPDFFGKRFDSTPLKVAASVLVFIFLIPYTASLYNGLSRLFNMAFNIDYTWCVVGMAILTAIYVVIGGYMATAINDFVQGIIMLIGIVVVIAAVLKENGGLVAAIQGLAAVSDTTAEAGSFASILGPDVLGLSFVVILTSLGTWGLPQMVQKFYAIKDEKAIKRGTVISTVFALVVAGGCYFLGGFGRLYSESDKIIWNNGTPVFDSIVPAMLSNLHEILIGLIVILVLSASMSTLSSLVLTSSSTLTLDFILPLKKNKPAPKTQLITMRVLILFFILISSVIAIVQVKFSLAFIAQMMGISWGALAGAFLAPFLYSLYWKKVSKASVWASFIFGAGIMVLDIVLYFGKVTFDNAILSTVFSSPINCGVIAMLGGLILVPVVSLLFPDKKAEENAMVAFEKVGITSKK